MDFLGYDYVRMTAVDMHGIPRSKTVPGRHANKHIGQGNGATQFCGVMVMGPRSELVLFDDNLRHGNLRAAPQMETLHQLSWVGQPTSQNSKPRKHGQVICQFEYEDGKPVEMDCRYVAKKVLQDLRYTTTMKLLSTCEMEFKLFKADALESPHPAPGGMSFSSDHTTAMEPFLTDLEAAALDLNVDIEAFHFEYGAGMWKMNIVPDYGIKAADNVFLFKGATREIARQHGIRASFMTKPYLKEDANGLHFNHSLWSTDGVINCMFDEEDPEGLSDVARHWIAGLLKHAPAMQSLCGPTINCCRRYHNAATPGIINWGMEDRLCAFRVHSNGQRETYVENRLPSSAANPYLVMAATVAAGLDGLRNKLELPKHHESQGEMNRNLEDALQALEADEVMVKALGRRFVEWFCLCKRMGEMKTLEEDEDDLIPSPDEDELIAAEIKEYFDYI